MNGSSQKGFTLVELMIVVFIIGLISAWAIPNYRDHVAASKLAEAHEALTNYRGQMEQYGQDNRSYRNGANCGVAAPTTPKFFTLSCAAASDEEYVLTATAKADSGISGFTLTVNQVNGKATTAVPTGATAQPTCWSTKRNGIC